MGAVEDERVGKVVAVGDLEQSCPEVEVLALGEPGVVAQRVPLEQVAAEEDGRV